MKAMTRVGAMIFWALFFLLVTPALAAPPQGAKPIKITYAGLMPVGHMVTKSQQLFAELVEKESNGLIKVDLYPAGQLYTDKSIMDAFTSGAVEMGEIHPAMWAGKSPAMLGYYMLGAFDTPKQQWRFVDGPYTQILNHELVKLNTKILGWTDYGKTQGILTRKPATSRKDLIGLKVRALGAIDSVFFEGLGMKPTTVSSAETYMALMQGTVDAAFAGYSSMIERKWYEAAKYSFSAPKGSFLTYATFPVGVNLKWWNTLPGWAQDIISRKTLESVEWSRQAANKSDDEAEEKIQKLGVSIHYMSNEEWRAWKGEPMEKEKAYLLKVTGEVIGKQILDAMKAAAAQK